VGRSCLQHFPNENFRLPAPTSSSSLNYPSPNGLSCLPRHIWMQRHECTLLPAWPLVTERAAAWFSGCCATPAAVRASVSRNRERRPCPRSAEKVRERLLAPEMEVFRGYRRRGHCECSSPVLLRSLAAFSGSQAGATPGPETSENKTELRVLYVKYESAFYIQTPYSDRDYRWRSELGCFMKNIDIVFYIRTPVLGNIFSV
jgi:hypothetical protein